MKMKTWCHESKCLVNSKYILAAADGDGDDDILMW